MRFRCGGRCVQGPPHVDFAFNVFTWTAIALPSAFYFTECLPFLWSYNPYVPGMTAVLLVVCVILLLLTSFSDPGIIPRHALRLMVDGLEKEVVMVIGYEGFPVDIRSGERDPNLMAQLEPAGYRWCPFCRMIQPPRAKHCRDCDCCVMRHDHHCPFVNNCIGQRNYVWFCGFLLSLVCLGVAVFVGILMWFSSRYENDGGKGVLLSEPFRTIFLWVLGIPTSLFLFCVVGLTVFHLVLICSGRTTREVLTGRRRGEGRTLFGYRGPSLVRATAKLQFPEA